MSAERVGDWPEDELVGRLLRGFGVSGDLVVGPGDDCAVVGGKRRQLLKTDCLVEGVHFLREHRAEAVGWKAMARCVSDFAAMAGTPKFALVTVAAPEDLPVAYLEGIYRGVRRAVREYGVQLAGGETSRSPGALFLNVAMCGDAAPGPILRSGSRSGDVIFVTGRLGGSFASGRHLRIQPRLREAQWLAELRGGLRPTAMMDLSDGLGADLPRLAEQSRCGYEVEEKRLPRARGVGIPEALGDGEDYELLFTVRAGAAEALLAAWRERWPRLLLTPVGRMVPVGEGRELSSGGYSHFSGRSNKTVAKGKKGGWRVSCTFGGLFA